MGVCVHQKFVFFFDTFFALFSIRLGNYDGFGGIRISSLILIFGRHLSNRPLKIRGYQKSHFLIFFGAFFCHKLWWFLKKLMNCTWYGHFWAALKVMSVGIYLRPPGTRNSMKHQGPTQKNKINFQPFSNLSGKTMAWNTTTTNLLKIRHGQEDSVLALWVLTLKFASNLYMPRRDFRCSSDIETQCDVNFVIACNLFACNLTIFEDGCKDWKGAGAPRCW